VAILRRFRFWRRRDEEPSLDDSLLSGMATAEPLEQWIHHAARLLLVEGRADRAGVWLPNEEEPEVFDGIFLDRRRPELPEASSRLDGAQTAIAQVLRTGQPIFLPASDLSWPSAFQPLTGMEFAALLPLHRGAESQGLALAAYAGEPMPGTLGRLRVIADAMAISISERRLRARNARLSEWLRALAEIDRAVAAGESLDGLLQRVVAGALLGVRAVFAGVARRKDSAAGLFFGAFDGPVEILSLLAQEPLAQFWRSVLRDRSAAVENLASQNDAPGGPQALRRWDISTVLALPLDAGGEMLGLLAVGLRPATSPAAARVTLEPLASLAAAALRDHSRRAEAEASDATLSTLLESGSEMFLLLDSEGRIERASRTARERLGLDSARMGHLHLEGAFPVALRPAVYSWRSAAQRGEFPAALELSLEKGSIYRLRVHATQLPGGRWQAGLEDLTALRSAERRGREVDAELAAVLDSMESGTLLFDPRGRLRLANARFAHLLGLDPARLAQIPDFESLLRTVRNHFQDAAVVEERWREIMRQGDEAAWDELELVHPCRRVVERFSRPVLSADGERLGWLELYRDITGQRLIQSKLVQTEKMAALGQLVSGIAHELNNPLTGIMGYAQLLLSRSLGPQRSAEAERIFAEAERARHIVKNLLLFARESKPERKPVQVNDIVERTLALRSYELKLQNIAIERELDADLPPALADAHQLQQVVLNLLVNAEQSIQASHGSGRITVRTRRISPHRMAIDVADDGPGIPAEILSRIFDPFFTTKPVGVGTGLGLSILYGIVQEHGGEVTVENHPGHGATFVVELPITAESIAEPAREVPRIASAAVAPLGGARVLVIEDEPTVAQLVVDVLREEGHHAEAMLDSVEALARLCRERFDLVVCDLKMPRLDGQALHHALVESGNPAQHRMLFITGDTLTARTLEFLERNKLMFLAKPFLVEELTEAVQRMLETKGLRIAARRGLLLEGNREASRKA
jgi:signal transduction histidine kinase/ActR/RegA family two-component response regulator